MRLIKNAGLDDLLTMAKLENTSVSDAGVLFTFSGPHTGRSPNAKKIVRDDVSKDTVCWKNNNSISEKTGRLKHLENLILE